MWWWWWPRAASAAKLYESEDAGDGLEQRHERNGPGMVEEQEVAMGATTCYQTGYAVPTSPSTTCRIFRQFLGSLGGKTYCLRGAVFVERRDTRKKDCVNPQP